MLSIIKVKKTAMCAITLFSFFNPNEQKNNTNPNQTGINAVGEVTSK